MRILFIGHAFHRLTLSSSFFIKLLKQLGDVEEIYDSSLDNVSLRRDYARLAQAPGIDLIVIWQIEYAAEQLCHDPRAVFVPMYDGARHLSLDFWRRVSSMRVLCFSIELFNTVSMFCPNAVYALYAPPRPDISVSRKPDSAYFWYRRDDLTPSRLQYIINTFRIRSIDILLRPDYPETARLTAPDFERLSANVKILEWEEDPMAQLRKVGSATFYVASRRYEGIGMSFLEAMSVGCIVIAPETSTYTDYIVSGKNGFLYDALGRIDVPAMFEPLRVSAAAMDAAARNRSRWLQFEADLIAWLNGGQPRPYYSAQRQRRSGPAKRPTFTVATVVRNAVDDIARTFESVTSQVDVDFDFVVVDGASTDGTLEFLKRNSKWIDTLVSEADRGPYFAMNKAADLAKGEFVIFMNAGDQFASEHSLSEIADAYESDADFIVGHHVYLAKDGRRLYNRVDAFEGVAAKLRSGSLSYHWRSRIPGHQSTATRVSLLRQKRYNTAFRIAADHELMFRAAASGSRFAVVDAYIALYEGGGLSSQNQLECLKEWTKIGVKYSINPRSVYRFYAPEMLIEMAAIVYARGSMMGRLRFIVSEWKWIVVALGSLPPAEIVAIAKRIARRALRAVRTSPRVVDLRRDSRPALSSSSGLSWPEANGTWTDWPNVQLSLSTPQVDVSQLTLEVAQLGPSLVETFVELRLDDDDPIRLPLHVGKCRIEFPRRTVRTLFLTVPIAASSAESGTGNDTRVLGILIRKIVFA